MDYIRLLSIEKGEKKSMFGEERHEKIVHLLKSGKTVSVLEIAQKLFVSEATVRRDLNALEREGVVRRVYGGAVLVGVNSDVPLLMRETQEHDAKQKIGQIAASLIKENDVIFMDASSTVYNMIPYIKDFHNLVVITSGIKTAMALGARHIKTYLTGGLMIDNSYSLIGEHANQLIDKLNVDIFFFSCRGITEEGKMTDSSMEESQLRQLMFKHTKRRVVLATNSKIGKSYYYVLGDVRKMDDIVSDKEVPELFYEKTSNGKQVRVWHTIMRK